MYPRITVEQQLTPETKEEWAFTLFETNIVFVGYRKFHKAKRTYKCVDFWDNYRKRESTIPEPIIPEEIKFYAIQKIKDMLTVKTFKEYRP